LGTDFGVNRSLTAIALALWCLTISLELQYWRYLSISTLVGIQELSPPGEGRFLRDGIYGVVRLPRYLSAGIGLVAGTLFVNYLGVYILAILVVPLGYLLLTLEERELVDRFGDAYRTYQREVPQLIPRWPIKRDQR
jgi:protein-S-isoprenylcysteine O-methyltransferase Ste14